MLDFVWDVVMKFLIWFVFGVFNDVLEWCGDVRVWGWLIVIFMSVMGCCDDVWGCEGVYDVMSNDGWYS